MTEPTETRNPHPPGTETHARVEQFLGTRVSPEPEGLLPGYPYYCQRCGKEHDTPFRACPLLPEETIRSDMRRRSKI